MTSETAREFAAAYKAVQMDRVMNRIILASKSGKYSTMTDEDLSDNTISLLLMGKTILQLQWKGSSGSSNEEMYHY